MDIEYKCIGCGISLVSDGKYTGMEIQCPKCKKTMKIPDKTSVAKPPVSGSVGLSPQTGMGATEPIRPSSQEKKSVMPPETRRWYLGAFRPGLIWASKKKEDSQQMGTRDTSYSAGEKRNLKPLPIVIANQKGGCGKTTTAINLSAALARKDFKVLIIDLDAQSHASLGIGIDVDNLSFSIYDVMVKNLEMERVILPTYLKNLDIAPATSMLTGAQLEIADLLGRERILRTAIYKMLNTNAKIYDYIIMDCSPSLNLLTINGLAAARSMLIPLQSHYFSLEGMKELFATMKIVKERLNHELEILGILPTLFDARTKMNKDILQQIKDYFKDSVFQTVIRTNIKLAEASLSRKSIFEYDPTSHGAQDYLALAEEVISLTQPELGALKSENKFPVPESIV